MLGTSGGVTPQSVQNLRYIQFLKGAFSDVLEGVVIKIFSGQALRAPFLPHYSNFLSTFYIYSHYKTMRNAFLHY